MPILDRHWWLRVLLACGASILAIAYVAWCVRTALSIPPRSPFPPGPAVIPSVIVIPLLLFLTARYSVVTALPSRRRARLAAIQGVQEEVPASLIVPRPERAPDVAAAPLAIAWHPFTFRRIDSALAWVVLVLALGLLLLITFFMSLGEARASYRDFPEVFLHAMLSALLVSGLGIAFLIAATVVSAFFMGGWSMGFAAPVIAFFGKPFDVVANTAGITAHDPWGRAHHVRWDDTRLLEVSIAPSVLGRYRVFTLYGRDSYARWRDDTGSDVSAPIRLHGITREEGAKRLQSMLDLIAARTGHTPRTFDSALAADRRSVLPRPLGRILRMLPLALACAVVAVVCSLFPLTNAGALNSVTSAAYVILAASCLVFPFIYRRRSPTATRERVDRSDTGATTIDQDSRQTYVVYTAFPRSMTLTILFSSLLIWLAALPLLFAWLGTLGMSAFQALQLSHLWPSQAAAVLVGFAGGVGLLICAFAAVGLSTTSDSIDVQADAEGLRAPGASKDSFLPWDAVDVMTLSAQDDSSYTYTAIGDYARTTITWPASSATPARADPRFIAVTPEQFAALVVARSGKRLSDPASRN